MLRPETISQAVGLSSTVPGIRLTLFRHPRADPLWDALARPVNHNPAILLRTQDLPQLYEENSACTFQPGTLEQHRTRSASAHSVSRSKKPKRRTSMRSGFSDRDLLLSDRLKPEDSGLSCLLRLAFSAYMLPTIDRFKPVFET